MNQFILNEKLKYEYLISIPGAPLTYFKDGEGGGGGGPSDFFGSEILAKSGLRKKKQRDFWGLRKKDYGIFWGMLKNVVIFLGRQTLKL